MSRRSSSRRSRNKGRGSRYSPGSPDHSSAPPISMWPKQYAHQDAARPGALSNSLTDQLRNASTDSRASGIDVIHRYRPPNRSSLHCSGQRNHDQYSAAHGYLATPRASQDELSRAAAVMSQRPPVHHLLHTTGGRPWTMYSMPRTEETSARNHSSASPRSYHADEKSVNSEVKLSSGQHDGLDGDTGERAGVERRILMVVSYNVLADSLISLDYIPYCASWNAEAWRARPGRTLQKMLEFKPDILCLQEVDEDAYTLLYKQDLESIGYRGIYCKRSGDKKDGCATFVLQKNLKVSHEERVMYKIPGHPVLDRDNVALLAVVDVFSSTSETDTHGGSHAMPDSDYSGVTAALKGGSTVVDGANQASVPPCPAGASRIVIANTHLIFNPKRGDIKMAQLMVLTKRVERLAHSSKADGVVVCGDFNMTPDSALYHYMVKGELDVGGLDRFAVTGQCGLVTNSWYDQRQEVDHCGVRPHRQSGCKHQGGGCTLGSFRHPFATYDGRDRGKGRGAGSRARPGRGYHMNRGARGRRQLPGRSRTPFPSPSCGDCSRHPPDAAPSEYVTSSHPRARGVSLPPNLGQGSQFAIMDPTACFCTRRIGTNTSERYKSLKRAKYTNDIEEKPEDGGGSRKAPADHMGSTPWDYAPPVLWPELGKGHLANAQGLGAMMHNLQLKSAYAQHPDGWGTGEPAFTTYHHKFKGTVDYVFYGPGLSRETSSTDARRASVGESGEDATSSDRGCLRCISVAEAPLRCELDQFQGLPSSIEPSDHILLAVRFEVVGRDFGR